MDLGVVNAKQSEPRWSPLLTHILSQVYSQSPITRLQGRKQGSGYSFLLLQEMCPWLVSLIITFLPAALFSSEFLFWCLLGGSDLLSILSPLLPQLPSFVFLCLLGEFLKQCFIFTHWATNKSKRNPLLRHSVPHSFLFYSVLFSFYPYSLLLNVTVNMQHWRKRNPLCASYLPFPSWGSGINTMTEHGSWGEQAAGQPWQGASQLAWLR